MVEIKRLSAKKHALELSLLQHPDNVQIQKELMEVDEMIEMEQETMERGYGLRPRWL